MRRFIPNRFLIVRHGESIWNQDSKFTGWTNIPLSDGGREEARRISRTLMQHDLVPNVIFTSTLHRCIETSSIVKKEANMGDDVPLLTSWRLNEKHYGTLEGIPRQYIRDKYGEKFTKLLRTSYTMRPPFEQESPYKNEYPIYRNCYFETIKNGESKENVLDRLLPYYENDILYTMTEQKFPLIVTHKHTARVLMKHLLKMDDQAFESYEFPSKTVVLINLDDNLQYDNHIEFPYVKMPVANAPASVDNTSPSSDDSSKKAAQTV